MGQKLVAIYTRLAGIGATSMKKRSLLCWPCGVLHGRRLASSYCFALLLLWRCREWWLWRRGEKELRRIWICREREKGGDNRNSDQGQGERQGSEEVLCLARWAQMLNEKTGKAREDWHLKRM